ncbi:MAG: hypothetical protein JWP42_2567 [Pseudomonas sp.]|nr:hypothetical protein [Pseudomonas sp.]
MLAMDVNGDVRILIQRGETEAIASKPAPTVVRLSLDIGPQPDGLDSVPPASMGIRGEDRQIDNIELNVVSFSGVELRLILPRQEALS